MGLMPVSFSRLNTFENCQQQFDYLYVTKCVQSAATTATDYGTRVHLALELRGRALCGDEVAAGEFELLGNREEFEPFLPLADKIVSKSGEKKFEFEMAIKRDKSVCGWSDEGVWIRSIADVLVVDGKKATVVDWKTGKKKDDPTQLMLFALMTFIHFPEVEEVTTGYVWLKSGQITDAKYTRRMVDGLWRAIEPRFDRLQEAVDLGVFKTRPSGLCPWCPGNHLCTDARKR